MARSSCKRKRHWGTSVDGALLPLWQSLYCTYKPPHPQPDVLPLRGRRPNDFLGQPLNDSSLFPVIMLIRTVSVSLCIASSGLKTVSFTQRPSPPSLLQTTTRTRTTNRRTRRARPTRSSWWSTRTARGPSPITTAAAPTSG